MVFKEKVERAIRLQPGIGMQDLKLKFKCKSKTITNAIVGLKKAGVAFKNTITGSGVDRQALYTIIDNNKQTVEEKTVSSSIIPNLLKKYSKHGLTDDQVIASFSDSDRSKYFSLKATGRFNTESANLLLNVRRETLIQESEAPRVSFKV